MSLNHTAAVIIVFIGLCVVLRPHQHSIGYMGDGFYRSKDPTNSIKVLKEKLQRKTTQTTQTNHQIQICIHTQNGRQIKDTCINTANPLVYSNMGWLGDGCHRGQGYQAWTMVGLLPRYPSSDYIMTDGCWQSSLVVHFLTLYWRHSD